MCKISSVRGKILLACRSKSKFKNVNFTLKNFQNDEVLLHTVQQWTDIVFATVLLQIFGPILPIICMDSIDDVVDLINDGYVICVSGIWNGVLVLYRERLWAHVTKTSIAYCAGVCFGMGVTGILRFRNPI